MIPVFRALAGRSPSWEAVFVQMEHCAAAPVENTSSINNTDNIRRHFFIILIQVQKYIQNGNSTSEKKRAGLAIKNVVITAKVSLLLQACN